MSENPKIHPEYYEAEAQEIHEKINRRKTLSRKEMAKQHRELRSRGELLQVLDAWHPTHRNQCRTLKRPCLFVSCRHHLFLDVNPHTGSVKYNFPGQEIHELEETCALDVAERGGATLDEVGRIMNLTRERIRQIEIAGVKKLKETDAKKESIDHYSDWDPRVNQAD